MNPALPTPTVLLARTRRGSALAATMMVVLALMTFLSIAALVTSQFGRFTARAEGNNELMAAGDAALEYMYAQWQSTTSAVFNKGKPPVSDDFKNMNGDLTLSTPVNGPLLKALNDSTKAFTSGVNFTVAKITLVTDNGVDDSSSPAVGAPTSNVPDYPGWSGTTYTYKARVTLTPTSTGYHLGYTSGSMPTLTLTRFFQVTQVPLFQAAIFYENKLEIHPGADMSVTGLVHTNGDLWARGFNKLAFQSDVSYVGKYESKGDATVTTGWDGFGGGQIPGVNTSNNPMPTFGTGADLTKVKPIDPFGGTDQAENKLHKIVESNEGGDKSNKQIAYNNAQLIIKVNSNPKTPSITITDGAGKSLSNADTAAVLKAVTLGTAKSFYDQRETTYVTATSLDMAKLAAATVNTSGGASTALQAIFATSQADPNKSSVKRAAGTVYIYDVADNTSTNMPAIRLINGSVLGQDVTVASSNPVYIQGDYNTGDTGTKVNSNTSSGNGTDPTNGTYNRYSSAVMADAVTILSSAWSDGASTQPLYNLYNGQVNPYSPTGNRKAAATTVNTAILAGDLPSNYNSNGYASGGAHNFPRFLENWNGVNFTYYGSLVEAFRSTTADSHWQTNQVYYWPNRRWWFDMNFMTNQPPGVPNGISYSRGRWARTNG